MAQLGPDQEHPQRAIATRVLPVPVAWTRGPCGAGAGKALADGLDGLNLIQAAGDLRFGLYLGSGALCYVSLAHQVLQAVLAVETVELSRAVVLASSQMKTS